MFNKESLRGSLNPLDFFRISFYKTSFSIEHPDYFKPDGTIVFCGPQGCGKTLSAVRYIKNLVKQYPKVQVISNVHLKSISYIEYPGIMKILETPTNGEYGTIIFIDEIQTEFSSLESKKINPSVISMISQQRKRRFHIVGTSQLFNRIAKPFREQINCVVDCDSIFGFIQRNRIIDFDRCAYDINGNLTETAYSGQFIWTRKISDFEEYDTTSIIERKGVLDVV